MYKCIVTHTDIYAHIYIYAHIRTCIHKCNYNKAHKTFKFVFDVVLKMLF